ncbi:MAG: 3-deoxy-manno-octulosonate cytidylyltransferase [Verrucomicrobia bacterium]|nr:MAG: 3-deoxy-manno-octulosonate cytidylyltransferase [Verrucomicrobiota bacterium]
MKTAAVIPCRFQSSRFEGKPLATIGGKPMMWHVYQQVCKACSIEVAYIATESEEIGKVCDELGMRWIMTSDQHLTGTDRVAECARKLDADVIVNVQGDEPFILPESIDAVTNALIESRIEGLAATNGYGKIDSEEDESDQGVVKVIFSQSYLALAYSRLPIPLAFRQPSKRYRQLGLYAFHRKELDFFATTKQGPLEASESVEMYRFVEHDRPVLMVGVEESGVAVDTPADLFEARKIYEKMHS